MKNSLLILLLTWSIPSNSQVDIGIKLGACKAIRAPDSHIDRYYQILVPQSPYPALHVYASIPGMIRNTNVTFSLGMIPTFSDVTLSGYNLDQGGIFRFAAGIAYSYQILTMFDRRISKYNQRLNKNYFSLSGGLAFWPFQKGLLGTVSFSADGYTNDGKHLEGSHYDAYSQSLFTFAVDAGPVWHITNHHGKDVLQMSLIANYCLNRYYDYRIYYSLDNVPYVETIKEKGFFVEFGVQKRIFSFARHR
jgi:hypothetical protein